MFAAPAPGSRAPRAPASTRRRPIRGTARWRARPPRHRPRPDGRPRRARRRERLERAEVKFPNAGLFGIDPRTLQSRQEPSGGDSRRGRRQAARRLVVRVRERGERRGQVAVGSLEVHLGSRGQVELIAAERGRQRFLGRHAHLAQRRPDLGDGAPHQLLPRHREVVGPEQVRQLIAAHRSEPFEDEVRGGRTRGRAEIARRPQDRRPRGTPRGPQASPARP